MFYDGCMPRKTLVLISALVLVTVVLFIIALRTSNQQNTQQPTPSQMVQQAAPTSPAHSVLMLSPNPVTVVPGQEGKVSVNIDTADNAVTAVQLEIAYDPNVIGSLQVTPGPLFSNPVVLINKNNTQSGRMTYAFGIAPNQQTIQGTGAVATITFIAKSSAVGKQSQLALLPTTLVTARGIASSVLKSSSGTIVSVSSVGGGTQQTAPLGQ